jgi:PAS domain S-box-containing protein
MQLMDQQFSIKGKTQTEVLELLDNFQRALETEKKYHDTLDNLLEGFQMIGFDWRYLYVNNTVVSQSKFSREELLGRTMMEKYPGIEKTEMYKTLSLCMNARISKHFDNEFIFPDGSSSWFELSVQPVEEGIIILSNDITGRKRSEKEKIEYTKDLEEMIFMTSHSLRQPIVHIIGLASLLDNCNNSEEELAKIGNYLKEAAISLDIFTKELTGFIHALEIKAKK